MLGAIAPPKMSLLCVHVPAFALAIARREHPGVPPDEPAVLVDKSDRGRVIELDPSAHALGARIGQTVLQARTAAGGVHVLVLDAHHSRLVWNDVLDALDAVSPLVDDSGEGTAYLDMRGIDGDAPQWIARALHALRRFDLPVRAAVGENKFTARAFTYAPDGRIDNLAIDVLQLEPRILERLYLLGVRTLGELAALPHGPFVRRFGKASAAWHDRARGIDPTPFHPRAHELQIDAAAYGEGSVEAEEQVLFALRVLADRVCNDLERAGKAACAVQVHFECESGDVYDVDAGFSRVTADARMMLDVVRAKLEGVTFTSPVSGLRMQVRGLEECGTVATLFGQQQQNAAALAVALARLQAVTQHAPRCARTRQAPRLEDRFAYDPFSCRCQLESVASPLPGASFGTPQLRLVGVKEIDVAMRGNAPVRVRGKRVLDCAGPWRVDDAWFDAPTVRDEYDVLLEDGMLCRIYRQGCRWYLRGTYD